MTDHRTAPTEDAVAESVEHVHTRLFEQLRTQRRPRRLWAGIIALITGLALVGGGFALGAAASANSQVPVSSTAPNFSVECYITGPNANYSNYLNFDPSTAKGATSDATAREDPVSVCQTSGDRNRLIETYGQAIEPLYKADDRKDCGTFLIPGHDPFYFRSNHGSFNLARSHIHLGPDCITETLAPPVYPVINWAACEVNPHVVAVYALTGVTTPAEECAQHHKKEWTQ